MARSRSSSARQTPKAGGRQPVRAPAPGAKQQAKAPAPQARQQPAKAPERAAEASYPGLRRFNAIMGMLHLLQGVAMVVLRNATTYPVYSNFLIWDADIMGLRVNPVVEWEVPFGPAVAVFLFISAVAHFYLATFGYPRYVANLRRQMNPVRFYEYALSSSLMIVLIGMLVGIYDMGALILMFGLNAAMNLFGLMMERHNQTTTQTDWTAFVFGCIAGIIPWVVIFIAVVAPAIGYGQQPPFFVYVIMVSLFLFFNSFAVNMYLQYKKVGRWADYLFGERMFIVLSLVAKTALAWQIFAGTLAPV